MAKPEMLKGARFYDTPWNGRNLRTWHSWSDCASLLNRHPNRLSTFVPPVRILYLTNKPVSSNSTRASEDPIEQRDASGWDILRCLLAVYRLELNPHTAIGGEVSSMKGHEAGPSPRFTCVEYINRYLVIF